MTDAVVEYRTVAELDSHLDHIRNAPTVVGSVELIVARPARFQRTVIEAAVLDLDVGLVGDSWSTRKADPNPDAQLNIMSARAIAAIAGAKGNWAPAGDQFYLDFDIGHENVPTGTRLHLGPDAVIEVTAKPHTGCPKFRGRYGIEAMRWVNSPAGRALRMRGLCAKVVTPGVVRLGDKVTRA